MYFFVFLFLFSFSNSPVIENKKTLVCSRNHFTLCRRHLTGIVCSRRLARIRPLITLTPEENQAESHRIISSQLTPETEISYFFSPHIPKNSITTLLSDDLFPISSPISSPLRELSTNSSYWHWSYHQWLYSTRFSSFFIILTNWFIMTFSPISATNRVVRIESKKPIIYFLSLYHSSFSIILFPYKPPF